MPDQIADTTLATIPAGPSSRTLKCVGIGAAAVALLVVVVGTAAPGEIRKYYREQVGALVYGAMSGLRGTRELRAARK